MYKIRLQYFVGVESDKDGKSQGACPNLLEQELIERFGGFTRTKSIGGWQGPNGTINEMGIVITILTTHHLANYWFRQTGEDLRAVYNQSQVIGTQEEVYTEEFNFTEKTA